LANPQKGHFMALGGSGAASLSSVIAEETRRS